MSLVRPAVNDVIKLKKAHPCGANEWKVVRLGMEVGLVCQGCGRELKLMRAKLNDDFRGFVRRAQDSGP